MAEVVALNKFQGAWGELAPEYNDIPTGKVVA